MQCLLLRRNRPILHSGLREVRPLLFLQGLPIPLRHRHRQRRVWWVGVLGRRKFRIADFQLRQEPLVLLGMRLRLKVHLYRLLRQPRLPVFGSGQTIPFGSLSHLMSIRFQTDCRVAVAGGFLSLRVEIVGLGVEGHLLVRKQELLPVERAGVVRLLH